ncbi:MAG: hypothetical protein GY774_16455 [Planctomycetes bacterium]|nr:hypothetical protein [Planctomycetota bacterium]
MGLAEDQAAELQILADKVLVSSSLKKAKKRLVDLTSETAKIPGQKIKPVEDAEEITPIGAIEAARGFLEETRMQIREDVPEAEFNELIESM